MAFPLVQLVAVPAKGKSIYSYSDNNVPTGTFTIGLRVLILMGNLNIVVSFDLAGNASNSYGK